MNVSKVFQTGHEAQQFLHSLGASPKLLLHTRLVTEAGDLLISKLQDLQVRFDATFIRAGIVFHDAGKIIHPEELANKGSEHEAAGERLLIKNGVAPELARCCRSHNQWQTMECSLEELCIALADTLWKGKRKRSLEEKFVEMLASRCERDFWARSAEMDSCFEMIAAAGDSRLLRS